MPVVGVVRPEISMTYVFIVDLPTRLKMMFILILGINNYERATIQN